MVLQILSGQSKFCAPLNSGASETNSGQSHVSTGTGNSGVRDCCDSVSIQSGSRNRLPAGEISLISLVASESDSLSTSGRWRFINNRKWICVHWEVIFDMLVVVLDLLLLVGIWSSIVGGEGSGASSCWWCLDLKVKRQMDSSQGDGFA